MHCGDRISGRCLLKNFMWISFDWNNKINLPKQNNVHCSLISQRVKITRWQSVLLLVTFSGCRRQWREKIKTPNFNQFYTAVGQGKLKQQPEPIVSTSERALFLFLEPRLTRGSTPASTAVTTHAEEGKGGGVIILDYIYQQSTPPPSSSVWARTCKSCRSALTGHA